MRGVMGIQNTAATYGNTGEASIKDFGSGLIAMETGAYDSFQNIKNGNGTWQDWVGMAMMIAPVGQGKRDLEAKLSRKADDAEGKKMDEEDGAPKAEVQEGESGKKEGEHEAFESTKSKLKQIDGDPPFEQNTNHDTTEFRRQIEGQEKGLNKLTVDEFIKNRDAYKAKLAQEKLTGKKNPSGRSEEGSKAQKKYREKVEKEKIKEFRKQGLTLEEAKVKAKEYMKDKAALHDPDQIAGGHGTNITGLGDTNVNSSIGSQWKTRIDAIDTQIREQAAGMTPEQMQNTFLNIKLPWN